MTEIAPEERMLNALDALTKPNTVAEWRDDGTVFSRTDPPLLEWLVESVGNNVGGSGSGKAARERIPIDITTLELYEDIEGRARSWLTQVGARPGKDVTPAQMLRTWYVLWSARNPSDNLRHHFTIDLESWADRIRDAIDPPKRIEITTACPVCGQEWINIGLKLADGTDDPNDVERVRVLVAVERENMETSFAMCRACDRVWRGTGEMRQLRILIDDADAARASVVEDTVAS